MIKGCRRSMIVIRNTGSDRIEEAYFILKNEPGHSRLHTDNSDIIAEANRIIDSNCIHIPELFSKKEEKRKLSEEIRIYSALRWYAAGFISAIAITALLLIFR